MFNFLLVTFIILAVSCNYIREIIKARQWKLIAFYAVTFGVSLTLVALHCFGINTNLGGV